MSEYEQTSLYKAGVRAMEWGKLLMNADTTLRDVSDFAFRYSVDVRASLTWKPIEKDPADVEPDPPEPVTLSHEDGEGVAGLHDPME